MRIIVLLAVSSVALVFTGCEDTKNAGNTPKFRPGSTTLKPEGSKSVGMIPYFNPGSLLIDPTKIPQVVPTQTPPMSPIQQTRLYRPLPVEVAPAAGERCAAVFGGSGALDPGA